MHDVMIFIRGVPLRQEPPGLTEKGKEIFASLRDNDAYYYYHSFRELAFDIFLRENIIQAAERLSKAGIEFNVFSQSRFHSRFWNKTPRGYVLKPGAMPDEAVSDIFTNGREYAFECSTAMVVVFYYAVLLSIGPRHFNRLFQNLLVWNWNYDENLKIITKSGRDYIPGDVVYFHNPDFQNPVWIGENAVYMGNDMYYGHDIGIVAKKEMIEALNQLRKPGAKRSAYMLPQHSRLDFRFYMGFAGHFSPAAPGVRSM
ncbi:MAG: protein-glutamine gamma-glutamyltransferase [Bacillales bacterium]